MTKYLDILSKYFPDREISIQSILLEVVKS